MKTLSQFLNKGTSIVDARFSLFIFLLFPVLLFAQQKQFVMQGKAIGFADGTEVKITTTAENPAELVKGKIEKGKFELSGSVQEPGLYFIVVGQEQPQHLFLDNSHITVEADKKALKEIKISGSPSHSDFVVFRNIFNPLIGELNGKAALLGRTPQGPEWVALKEQYDSIANIVQVRIDKYITARPSSFVSLFLLSITAQMNDDVVRLEDRFKKLDAAVKLSEIGKGLEQYINYYKVGAIGTEAIDFTQPDTNGQAVSLSSFRGKYVLVDFWASWCGPCRNENPNVVANYNKFKDKNFTVLGVSLDRQGQKDRWLKAIEQDNLTWTHVSDLKYWDNAAAQLYHVTGIPFNILVDPAGKIVGRNLRGPELELKLCEVLGCTMNP